MVLIFKDNKTKLYKMMNSDNNLSELKDNLNSCNTKSKDYSKKKYAENKEQKLAYLKEKVCCEVCNTMIARVNMADHKKTILHNKNLELVNKNKELVEKDNEINYKPAKDSILLSKIEELDTRIKEIKEYINNKG
jgi:hypothetical protein